LDRRSRQQQNDEASLAELLAEVFIPVKSRTAGPLADLSDDHLKVIIARSLGREARREAARRAVEVHGSTRARGFCRAASRGERTLYWWALQSVDEELQEAQRKKPWESSS
jgi:hypothetical protein